MLAGKTCVDWYRNTAKTEMTPVFSVNQRLFTFCADDGESIQFIIWGPCMQEKRFLILDEGGGLTN